MQWSRRAIAASVALVLAGCAGANGDSSEGGDSDAQGDRSDFTGLNPEDDRYRNGHLLSDEGEAYPPSWWSWVPDLLVINHQTSGMTAYVSIRRTVWLNPLIEETVSIRGRPPGGAPVTVSLTDPEIAAASGILEVKTAMGVEAERLWHGTTRRTGLRIHVFDDHIEFDDVKA